MSDYAGVPNTPLSGDAGLNAKPGRKWFWPVLLFAAIAVAGVFYVKWNPYYHKALLAASKHSIGASIISGKSATAPAPSWSAAWNYAVTYFKAVWQAVILGLLLGSLVQVLLPKDWVQKVFGSTSLGGTAAAGMAALPSMMCTCCSAPVAVGLRQRSASVGSALAYFLANPLLNPATIIFMGFVLSWQLALFRVLVGIVLVLGLGYAANHLTQSREGTAEVPQHEPVEAKGNLFVQWLRALVPLVIDTIPAYLIVVFLLGAARAWLFPVISPQWSSSVLVIAGLAVAGTLFVIPTAAEIPVVQTLMSYGLGIGPAAALLITLPALSLPSLLMVRRAFPTKVLVLAAAGVILGGIASGMIAAAVF